MQIALTVTEVKELTKTRKVEPSTEKHSIAEDGNNDYLSEKVCS